MAFSLTKTCSLLTQLYLRYCASIRGLFIRGLPMYTDSHVAKKGNKQEKTTVSSQEKKKSNEEVFSANMAVRVQRPKPPPPSEGSGGKIH